MRKFRTLDDFEEEYSPKHPEEIDKRRKILRLYMDNGYIRNFIRTVLLRLRSVTVCDRYLNPDTKPATIITQGT